MRLPRNAAAFSVSGQVTDMKYINDKPIDFTNDDWKQYTPRERARLEQQEQKQRKQKVRKKRSLPVRIFTALFQALVVVLIAYVLVYTVGQQRTIVGQSMDTTLAGGDVVLINVMSYQVGSPKRGDLVSYRPNGSSNARADIKRVIGLPGSRSKTDRFISMIRSIWRTGIIRRSRIPESRRARSSSMRENTFCLETIGTTRRIPETQRSDWFPAA